MPHDGCEEIQLLISRLVDDEVSPSERERVEQHVAVCDACACKMLEFMEMAVLFSETPLHQPDPELRASLFREIGNIEEEGRLKKQAAPLSKEKPWFLPASPANNPRSGFSATFLGRLLQAASPLAVAATALFVFLGALLLGNRLSPDARDTSDNNQTHRPVPLATRSYPIIADVNPPLAVETKVGGVANASPPAHASSYVNATATLGRNPVLQVMQPTPVMEDGDAAQKASWHTVQDPQYGYTISYPPNWWTAVDAGVRYFYPWTGGGTSYAPYWVEMRVSPNTGHYTAQNANIAVCGSKCEIEQSSNGDAVWLRRSTNEVQDGISYDEAYMFDDAHIYQFQVKVPTGVVPGAAGYQERWVDAQGIFGTMSGRLMLAGAQSSGASTFGDVLFLNGTDLWLASEAGTGAYKVTRGYPVRQFAESPDLRQIAFTTAGSNGGDPNSPAVEKTANDPWARAVYLTYISPNGPVAPAALMFNMDVHDIAWYGDHDLLVLAQAASGLALYKISVPAAKGLPLLNSSQQTTLLVKLPSNLSGAGSLAVSPDRQLITFLAPVGPHQGTDIYAVRPDGSDLMKLVSHGDPVAPVVAGAPVLAPDNQAIKSYLWTDGRLEPGGYRADLLYTCGDSYGPFSYPGGFLYSSANPSHAPLLDPAGVISNEPERMQIIQIAYSDQHKVALAGYKNDYNGRADQLVGVWTGTLSNGSLQNIQPQSMPQTPDGVADLQWSPDGASLIYREMVPTSEGMVTSRYDGGSDFRMMKLDVTTGKTVMLYDGER